ncbi:preprotein translocase subunit YajC [Hydrogenoanaerobacterium saccharovorans]|uniref:Preprotein translocase subunit YajC n=1 Tax=Hydrogenoanaerobacterium saccharovorans TaxID=474960 RepID=A0A1H7ZL98_9FIRM|nr:preprotein translocase subunit YajC [Hydrogenoanaerobacterium saccharovorans]RPF48514.1 preprotein translocase subunit YajC [Hydrogenoanaerobacterium saccharovorans]SEM59362.1 preprotein translocase subunit YajC [Hydrogenoanaerobacterium saccharovorans]
MSTANLLTTATNAAGAQNTTSMLVSLLPMVLIFVVFYFILIRPQKKRDKEIAKMRSNLEVGDEIVTIGGVVGRVVIIKEDTVVVETGSDRSKIRFLRSAIQQNNTAVERAAAEKATVPAKNAKTEETK